MTDSQRIKVPKKEFAEVLYHWLSLQLTKEQIEKTANDLDFKIKSDKDFNKILQELFTLNMWLIVYSCEGAFEDIDKRNECLDIFHRIVYERHTEGTEEAFGQWMMSLGAKYDAYAKAMATEHPVNPLWVFGKLISKNLFGKVRKDVLLQAQIAIYVVASTKHLPELIEKYEDLRGSEDRRWFGTGAGILLLGLVFGIVLGRQQRKRRSYY